jgi:hypothetical protein
MRRRQTRAGGTTEPIGMWGLAMQTYGRTILMMALLPIFLMSCDSVNPNSGRVLTAINVTPTTADASQFPNGEVTFTATGQFSLPPLSGPVTFTAPYTGQFIVANPNNQTIANIVSTGNGTVTVRCAAGVSATVDVVATAAANNGTQTTVTAQGQLTCP